MVNTKLANRALQDAISKTQDERFEFITPEMFLLYGIMPQEPFQQALASLTSAENVRLLKGELKFYIEDAVERVPEADDYEIEPSAQMVEVLRTAEANAVIADVNKVGVVHYVRAIWELEDSDAAYLLAKFANCNFGRFMVEVVQAYALADEPTHTYEVQDAEMAGAALAAEDEPEYYAHSSTGPKASWKDLVVDMNELVRNHNPLIGRELELERTIQVLCRKDKNNPLHIGEPGVGKTALVYGLVQRIINGNVPARLKNAHVYMIDLCSLLAGTQFRGDFEKRVQDVMEGMRREGDCIAYIDEIHNLVGAGKGSDGTMDASNMLKPYLEAGDIRFIGSTTYQEYNRYFAQSKGITRRFQQIDILEPSEDETIHIINELLPKYQYFHNVTYADGVVEYAVKMSAKYINERFLPDKAIDLIDEAGAYREVHPVQQADSASVVDKSLIDEILAKICKVKTFAEHKDDNEALLNLEQRISAQIYGQPNAVRQVVESVQMGKAGLLDDGKPVASLLFVGPTGVGKTEVTRVLAQELGLELVRFDMSEYAEKHTVAKLIGSPAGYVGYEDGGLLTDAIRKTPHCVLLLDEIEKAHSDIYNILLQIMDYARLTDNKGQHADFRNVILVMTSNAGAQYAQQATVGFASKVTPGEAMMGQVKKTFKPEFLNRLSGTVIFNSMDETMARLILDKKLAQLKNKLMAKNVALELSEGAYRLLLVNGFVPQYGAREMDRVLRQQLNPLLMRAILFGNLKNGGKANVDCADGKLFLVPLSK